MTERRVVVLKDWQGQRAVDISEVHLCRFKDHPDEGRSILELAGKLAAISPRIEDFLAEWCHQLEDEDRQKLKPYAARIVGTYTGPEDENKRIWLLMDWLIREYEPAWIKAAGLPKIAKRLRDLPPITDYDSGRATRQTLFAARAKWESADPYSHFAARHNLSPAAKYSGGAAAWCAALHKSYNHTEELVEWYYEFGLSEHPSHVARSTWKAGNASKTEAEQEAEWQRMRPTAMILQESAFRLLDRLIEVSHAG